MNISKQFVALALLAVVTMPMEAMRGDRGVRAVKLSAAEWCKQQAELHLKNGNRQQALSLMVEAAVHDGMEVTQEMMSKALEAAQKGSTNFMAAARQGADAVGEAASGLAKKAKKQGKKGAKNAMGSLAYYLPAIALAPFYRNALLIGAVTYGTNKGLSAYGELSPEEQDSVRRKIKRLGQAASAAAGIASVYLAYSAQHVPIG